MLGGMLATSHSEEVVKDRVATDPTYNKMEAGYNALFEGEGEQSMQTYFDVLNEQEEMGYSPSSVGLKDALHQEKAEMLNMEATNIVSNPNIDLNTRTQVAEYTPTLIRQENSLAENLAKEYLMEDDDAPNIPASDEYDATRTVMADAIKDVYAYRSAQQAVADSDAFTKSEFGVGMVADFAQMLVPFVEQSNVAEALVKAGAGSGSLQSFLLMGNAKEEFFNAFKRMPLRERADAIGKFFEIAESSNRTFFMDNGLLAEQMKEELLYGTSYSTSDKWIDNLSSLLDLTVFGKPLKEGARLLGNAKDAASGVKLPARAAGKSLPSILPDDILSTKEMVRTGASPVSPIRMASESNAEKSKALFNAIVKDESGEAAEALAGTTRIDSITDAYVPEVGATRVRSKVHDMGSGVDKDFLLDPRIKTALDRSAVGALTRKELDNANAITVNRLQEAVGVTSRSEMFNFEATPTGAKITGAYGPAKGGWSSSEEALSLVENSVKDYGLTRDNLFIMERGSDGQYAKVEEPTGSDFIVGIDYDYRVNFSNVTDWENFSVKRNFLDRVPLAAKGSLNRHLFSPETMLDSHITIDASASVDKASKTTKDLLDIARPFTDGIRKADPESKALIRQYLVDANEKQIPHSPARLKTEWGFSDKEVEVINSFREYWDNVWAARNIADVRTMRNEGYGVYEDIKGQDRLFTRKVEKGQVDRSESVYNPVTGITAKLSEKELEKLYAEGGTISKTRSYTDFGSGVTNQVLIKNDESWRPLKESDTVYPYREGYFQRTYTSPFFIRKEITTDSGKKVWKAVATAESRVDAKLYMERLKKVDGDAVYKLGEDAKNPKDRARLEAETYESGGNTSARVRGEKLEDATAVVSDPRNTNVLGPVDAIISTARSMGSKISMSESIQAMKLRFLEDFNDVLKVEQGQTKYPSSMDDIGVEGLADSKRAADARTTYEYISFLEYGYVNSMDTVTKWGLRGLASLASEMSLRATAKGKTRKANVMHSFEKDLQAMSNVDIPGTMKNLAFQMYLGTNPLRQFVLNAHQSTLLTGRFTKYVTSQRLAADTIAFSFYAAGHKPPKAAVKATGRSESELELMWREFNQSGLPSSIDQNNLLKGSMSLMAESNRYKGTTGSIGTALEGMRKVGFDAGEAINLTTAWLSHYDEARSAKAGLNATDFHEIAGKTRNFTFNMNRAGDMPYNSNSFSLLLQFMQVPHKSFLQSFNRALSREQRAKLFIYNAVMFSLPTTAMYSLFSGVLPDQNEHPEAHDAIVQGAQFFLFNKMLELATGEDVNSDFSSLAPMDSYGIFAFIDAVLTTDVGEVFANTPSGQLFFGANPRITNLVDKLKQFVYPTEMQDEAEMSDVYMSLGKLSSGFSNGFKAKMALDYQKVYGSRGQVLDPSVSTPEAILLAFGFNTMAATRSAWAGMEVYKRSEAYTDDVNKWYNEITRGMAGHTTAEEQDYHIKVMNVGLRAFGSDPKARSIIMKNLRRDYSKGSSAIHDYIFRSIGYDGADGILGISNAIGGESHENLKETLKVIREYEDKGGK